MRIAISAFLLFLLTLTALAGAGCRADRTDAPAASVTPAFCQTDAGRQQAVSVSAAQAQIAFDLQANNDDRTEMIAADFGAPPVPPVRHATARPRVWHDAAVWPRTPRRPPRGADTVA